MSRLSFPVLSLAISLALSGCGAEFSHPDTAGHEVHLLVRPFYKDLFAHSDEPLAQLTSRMQSDYPGYFDSYCQFEIRVGLPGSDSYDVAMPRFLAYDANSDVLPVCDSVFASIDISDELSDAFSCFATLFPQQPVPSQVLCHFSGFNDKMFVDSSFISFSIEHYLGESCPFYDMLEIPVYARRTRQSRFIVSDLVKAWVYSTLPDPACNDDVLSALSYQGRVLYAVHSCIPSISLADLFGFSDEQLRWCQVNEGRMWAYLAEHKLLYTTNMLDRNKIVNEAPFTSFFGNQSPGRAAIFCAYQMVCSFMKRNPSTSLPQLMAISDSQKILVGANYNPK